MNIEICNYTKKLSKNLVLENINLSLSGGKIYGFVGKNGSGKTMLMRAICGLILPTSGFVKINNKIIGKAAFLKRFKTFEIGDGVIFDKFQAFLKRTRREHGALFAEFFQKKCKRRTGAERVAIRFVENRNQKRRVVRNKL